MNKLYVEETCVICLELDPAVVFNCGHKCCCGECAKKDLAKCPLCRAIIFPQPMKWTIFLRLLILSPVFIFAWFILIQAPKMILHDTRQPQDFCVLLDNIACEWGAKPSKSYNQLPATWLDQPNCELVQQMKEWIAFRLGKRSPYPQCLAVSSQWWWRATSMLLATELNHRYPKLAYIFWETFPYTEKMCRLPYTAQDTFYTILDEE